jgi:hypothetical protein
MLCVFSQYKLAMKKFLLMVLCLLLACSARAQPPEPLLWKVSGDHSSVYLLGSMHLLTQADYPLAPAVDAAFADSAAVVFEIAPQGMDTARMAGAMVQAATRTDGKTLKQSLPANTWQALQGYARSNALDAESLQHYKPWFVALMVMMGESRKLGMDTALGLDQHFMERAAAAGKATDGLESAESQIALFDGMGAKAQLQFLQETLGDLPHFGAQMEELLVAWRQADEKALERVGLQDMRRDYPEFYQAVNVARNRAWLPRVEALLQNSKRANALVVVGALHLLGDDGLVHLLQRRGYRVQRLR